MSIDGAGEARVAAGPGGIDAAIDDSTSERIPDAAQDPLCPR